MYELLKEFIKPELLILIPVLYLLGASMKKSAVPDRYIPWTLGLAGVVLSLLFMVASTDLSGLQSIFLAFFSSITQGVLVAGASVYVNQLVKQAGKED
ncbi:MAG: hypothetical protein E7393_04795 [Ruminococcaceae bacterium]|nr:hypothetical protein [Oscillospiraceae bacterium]